MKLIVGLGNPGTEYTKTRHNVGFMVVDRLAARSAPGEVPKGRFSSVAVEALLRAPGTPGERALLLKPTTYMNRSGRAVQEALAFFKLDPARDLLVIVDEIYLPVGAIRLRASGSAGGHNGLTDVQRALGTDAYPRLRIGVGVQLPARTGDPDEPPAFGKPAFMDQADFVLSRFTEEESPALESSLDRAARAAEVFAASGLEAAMNQFNAPEKPATPRRPARERPSAGPAGSTDSRRELPPEPKP